MQLDDLDNPIRTVIEIVGLNDLLDFSLDIFVDLLFNLGLLREDILKKLLEEWDILSDELGQVHITKGSAHEHFFFCSGIFSELGTGGSEYGKNVS